MKQNSKQLESQVMYLGRWVSKEHFRTFVYNEKGKRLANSYDEYESLIGSGLWFPEPQLIAKKKAVSKGAQDNGDTNANS